MKFQSVTRADVPMIRKPSRWKEVWERVERLADGEILRVDFEERHDALALYRSAQAGAHQKSNRPFGVKQTLDRTTVWLEKVPKP